jgi:hypothetical protein
MVNEVVKMSNFTYNRTLAKSRGAAMTEAVIVMPVLLIMLFLAYQVYKVSIISTNAAVAGRSEMMMYAYSENFSMPGAWKLTKADYDKHESHFVEQGLFPDISSLDIDSEPKEGAFGAFQSFVAIATGMDQIKIVAQMPAIPFLGDRTQKDTFSCGYTGASAVSSWNWTEDLFGQLANWIRNMGEDPGDTLDNDINQEK